MHKFEQSLETKYLEEMWKRDLQLIRKEDIYLVIRNRERKYLIIVKQYPDVDSNFDFVQKKKIIKLTSKEDLDHISSRLRWVFIVE